MGKLELTIYPDRAERPNQRIKISTPSGEDIIIKATKRNGTTRIEIEADKDTFPIAKQEYLLRKWVDINKGPKCGKDTDTERDLDREAREGLSSFSDSEGIADIYPYSL